jgi:hypothetical protein
MSRGEALAIVSGRPQPSVEPHELHELVDGSLAAEREVLASMMLGAPDVIGRARATVEPADFSLNAHRKVFEAVLGLADHTQAADFVTVCDELRKRGELGMVGGHAFVSGLLEMGTTGANIEAHARIVREHAMRRKLRRAMLKAQELAQDATVTVEEIRAFGRSAFDAVPEPRARIEFLDLAEVRAQGIPPVPWLVPGWLAEQDVALVSGDGGIGKSTTIAALAIAVATGGTWCGIPCRAGRVLVVDEEQSQRELARLYLRLGAPHENLRVACQQGVNLTTADGLARLATTLTAERPTLTVFDSVQQVFAGVDGNDAGQVARVYAELFRLRRLYDTAFVLIGHLRKPAAEGQVSKLHLVHGSVAFGTQASTVWVATQPARGLLDLAQVKRRDGERVSLRIRYETAGPDAAIALCGEGPIEEQETVTERAQDFVVTYLTTHGTSQTAWLVKAAAGETPAIGERAVNRAVKHLVGLGRVERPRRGYYGLVGEPAL